MFGFTLRIDNCSLFLGFCSVIKYDFEGLDGCSLLEILEGLNNAEQFVSDFI
jgi:hypothetical protein